MQILNGIERRRRWQEEEKLRIIAEAMQPGASVSEIARRHDMSRALLWNWRRQARIVAGLPQHGFVPVKVTNPASLERAGGDGAACCPGRIEIAFPDGSCIRMEGEVSPAMLRRVIAALRR